MEILKTNERGQTVIEYLLLTLAAAVTALFVLPQFGQFAVNTVNDIRERIGTIAKDGEMSKDLKEPGQKGHPAHPERLKPLHF